MTRVQAPLEVGERTGIPEWAFVRPLSVVLLVERNTEIKVLESVHPGKSIVGKGS